MKEEYGQMIMLDYDGLIVKGHVSHKEFVTAVGHEIGKIEADDINEDELMRTYARWTPDSTGEYDIRLNFVKGPAQGAFPITVFG